MISPNLLTEYENIIAVKNSKMKTKVHSTSFWGVMSPGLGATVNFTSVCDILEVRRHNSLCPALSLSFSEWEGKAEMYRAPRKARN